MPAPHIADGVLQHVAVGNTALRICRRNADRVKRSEGVPGNRLAQRIIGIERRIQDEAIVRQPQLVRQRRRKYVRLGKDRRMILVEAAGLKSREVWREFGRRLVFIAISKAEDVAVIEVMIGLPDGLAIVQLLRIANKPIPASTEPRGTPVTGSAPRSMLDNWPVALIPLITFRYRSALALFP